MSWEEDLFSVLEDVEGQAEAVYAAQREAELADRTRAEYAAVTLLSRVLASDHLAVDLPGRGRLAGEVSRVGKDWFLLVDGGVEWIVVLAAVTGLHGASARSLPDVARSPLTRLGLGSALRRIADRGDRCVVHLTDGQAREGTLGRVGADFVESRLPNGTVMLIPFVAIVAVQRWVD